MRLACLLSLATLAAPGRSGAKLRWWQSIDKVFLDIAIGCSGALSYSVDVGLHKDNFQLRCDDTVVSEFSLRDFVLQQGSDCTQKSASKVHCVLQKEHPHFFDRLTFQADELRGLASIDFDRGSALESGGEMEQIASIDYADEPSVRQLSVVEFRALSANADVLFLDVEYPWCTHCASKKAAFVKAARALSSFHSKDDVIFAAIDAREERELRLELGATCTYSCTHLVMRRGETPTRLQVGAWGGEGRRG